MLLWVWCLTLQQVRRYLTFMKTTVSSKGQIVLPAEFRQMDRVEPGQEFDVERVDRGDYRLVRRATRPNQGAIEWLLACPQKNFFVPSTLNRRMCCEILSHGRAGGHCASRRSSSGCWLMNSSTAARNGDDGWPTRFRGA